MLPSALATELFSGMWGECGFDNGHMHGDAVVPVPRKLLREVIADGCCPVHLRLQLAQTLAWTGGDALNVAVPSSVGATSDAHHSSVTVPSPSPTCVALPSAPFEPLPACSSVISTSENQSSDEIAHAEKQRNEVVDGSHSAASAPFAILRQGCFAAIAAYLPLAEVLSVRCCSREPLNWTMERGAEEYGPRQWVYDRIRARLWMRRVADLTSGTDDERVFETRMRSLADDALRSRMETEKREALAHMEQQIHQFQAEVDRRLDEQERHVRSMVEERVQQELDAILASEVAKVQAMVEERVRQRVTATFKREVRETVRELQSRLDVLVDENGLLRDAFAEANLRLKCLFWALYPPPLQTAAFVAGGFSSSSFRRRVFLASCGHPTLPSSAGLRPRGGVSECRT
eukprot:TRINITY_DN74038_c0_g1_i1.p1 TRINITY_DN74038_c0_g1~~TRINITY_DN74038_c0_g1_i1.p1  ORF type:complete len:403 (+),score=56.60 TRINITY_DN74038_c0_g1_i1:32-1240(+)